MERGAAPAPPAAPSCRAHLLSADGRTAAQALELGGLPRAQWVQDTQIHVQPLLAAMSAPQLQNVEVLSDSDRSLLRKSVRDLLARHWPAEGAVERADDAQAIAAVWKAMAGQGLATLGSDPAEGGLREIVLVFEELGRASCPAPMLGAVAANLALTDRRSNVARDLLEQLHQGHAMVAAVLGDFDGDPAAGRVDAHSGALTGKAAFVEGAQLATHLLVFCQSPACAAIVASGPPGLQIQATPGLAVPYFAELTFDNTPAAIVDLSQDALADVAMVARLACAGRALGAAQRAFELSVEHAKLRKQFGQLIGQFQAVQHKLADNLVALDGARLTIEAAAQARDHGDPQWRVFAASALAFAGPALRAVSIQTHRALGAIGYAEEHEAPRHFRRVHADLARFGGAPRARAELADYLLGPA
jgi:alkylation response protein AidB-like acyl-CoA dehydrogenase